MVEQNALREIIEQVLGEMNISGNAAPKPTAAAAAQATTVNTAAATVVEDGFIPDITEVDVRKQYLVENPVNGPAYAELKLHAPCRLAIGKAGSRYKTEAQLQFRAAHSAAQDAVFSGVDNAIIEKMGFFKVDTKCDNKDTFLTRPDLGRQLSEEAVNTLREKCQKNPRVQIYVSDGLSSAAVAANVQDVYPALVQGLKSYGIEVGTPFYLEYGRVGAMDQVSEVTGAEVTCVLIGERPGLITAESMSAYMAYKGTVGMPEARRNVISNIHKDGTPPVEAGAHIAELIKTMLDQKTSGTDLVKA
ncbi:MAG: ethanolamine ammonia-lyase subunit EutC [Synergistaceae bacterium]|jgi:ethanolamine ammonia-lyase small subunit